MSVPIHYALYKLAQAWGVHPSVIEEGDPDWLLRGLAFQSMEASTRVTRSGPQLTRRPPRSRRA